jgi:plastocyanin
VTRRLRRAALTLPVAALAVAACADDANDHAYEAQRAADRLAAEDSPAVSAPTPAQAAAEPTGVVVAVAVLDNSFRPMSVEVAVGDTVVWENRGRNAHDVLSVDGTLADGTAWGVDSVDFGPDAIYSHVFAEPGEYRYYCTIHGTAEVGMVGTIIVTA